MDEELTFSCHYHRVDAWLQVSHVGSELFLQQHALYAQLIAVRQYNLSILIVHYSTLYY